MGATFKEKIKFRIWRGKYRIACWSADRWRAHFLRAIPERLVVEISPHRLKGVRVFSMCGLALWPEQMLSLLSFLRHVGVPDSFTIVSDADVPPETWRLPDELKLIVRIASWQEFITPENRAAVELYSAGHAMGKKLALVTGLPTDGKSVYVDSDILFFPGGHQLRTLLESTVRRHYFLHNGTNFFVDSLLTPEELTQAPVCAGFLIQDGPIDWQEPLARLQHALKTDGKRLLGETRLAHFMEQTVVHQAYNRAQATALAGRYVMTFADFFRYRETAVLPHETIFRHYPSVIRQFMWPWARDYFK
jgi:hypothetical protein